MEAPGDFARKMHSNIPSNFRGECAAGCDLSTEGELRFAATSCVILLPINGSTLELITKLKRGNAGQGIGRRKITKNIGCPKPQVSPQQGYAKLPIVGPIGFVLQNLTSE
jgi:hypothetical protein